MWHVYLRASRWRSAGDTVQSLGQEDALGQEVATYFSTLAWESPWTEEPGGLQSMGSQKSQTRLSTHLPQPHVYLILVNVFFLSFFFFSPLVT